MDQVKNYLESQNIVIQVSDDAESKLCIKKVTSVSGTASIAVVRGEPKMGYELELKVEMEGVETPYLDSMSCSLEIEGLVEYQNEPDSYDF